MGKTNDPHLKLKATVQANLLIRREIYRRFSLDYYITGSFRGAFPVLEENISSPQISLICGIFSLIYIHLWLQRFHSVNCTVLFKRRRCRERLPDQRKGSVACRWAVRIRKASFSLWGKWSLCLRYFLGSRRIWCQLLRCGEENKKPQTRGEFGVLKVVATPRIELGTRGFSIRCSTDWAKSP